MGSFFFFSSLGIDLTIESMNPAKNLKNSAELYAFSSPLSIR